MTARGVRVGAIALGVAALGLYALDLALIAGGAAPADEGGTTGAALWILGLIGAPTVGLVIVTRRPGNRYAWLLLSFGFVTAAGSAAGHAAQYAYAFYGPGHPAVVTGALIESVLWPMFPMHLPLLLLFFPNGRLPSARWRWLPRVVVPCGLSASALAVKIPGELGVADLANPYAAAGAAGTVVQVIVFTAVIVMFLCVVAATVSMVVHRRRSSGQERLQLRWFTWAAGMLAAVLVFTGAGALISNEVVNSLLFSVAMAGLFTAIGVAVLRYRLYEIDRIISRTVTYATVTVVVVAVYLGGVTVITTVTSPVAGDSPLAIAAATLAAAAVFGPARRRIQGSVDRRFNRARYDAERIVEGYRAHLRDEIDLRSLEAELRATVQATVQPTTTGLWLRSPGGQA